MALSAKVHRYSTPSSTGSNAQTGVGFQPKIIIPFGGSPTADATWTASQRFGIGAGVSSSERGYGSIRVADGSATSNADSQWDNDGIWHLYTAAGAANSALADLTSLDADGFTMNWSAASARRATVLALGGTDLQTPKIIFDTAHNAIADKAYTGVGFKPDLVIAIPVYGVTPGTDTSDALIGLGAFDKAGHQWAMAVSAVNGNATNDVAKRQQNTSHAVMLLDNAGAVEYSATFVSMDSDGFTLHYDDASADTTRDIMFVCFKGPNVRVGSFTKPNATTGNVATTGIGFTPKAVMFASFLLAAAGGAQADSLFQLSVSDGTTSGAICGFDDDGAGTSVAKSYHDALAYFKGTIASGTAASATMTSLDSDGWTLNWGTNDSVEDEILYIVWGDAFTGTGAPELPFMEAAGAGTETFTGSGAPDLPFMEAAGTGIKADNVGTGAPELPFLEAAGVGVETFTATGAGEIPFLEAAGTGTETFSGSGAAEIPFLEAAGAGEQIDRMGSGAAEIPFLEAAGSGTQTFTGSGAPELPFLEAAGAGTAQNVGTGAAELPFMEAAGVGLFAQFGGTGAAEIPFLEAAGAGTQTFTGSGAAELPFLEALGEGSHVTYHYTPPSVALLADLDRDGTYETDWSAYVGAVVGAGYEIERGLDPDGETIQVGTMAVALRNDDGRFNAAYEAGAHYGQLEDTDFPLVVRLTHLGVTYDIWTGYGDVLTAQAMAAQLTGVDLGAYLLESEEVNVTVSTTRDTGEAMQAVLESAAFGFTSADWVLDAGVSQLPYHFAGGQRGMDAIMEVQAAELGGQSYIDASGRFVFRSRYSRLRRTQYDREIGNYRGKGLEGSWWFDESASTVAYDRSGNARNGTYSGATLVNRDAPFTAVPVTEKCPDFDGTNDYISIADAAAWSANNTGSLTIAVLFRVDSLSAARTIVAKRPNGGGSGSEWELSVATDGTLTFALYHGTTGATIGSVASAAGGIVVDTWYQVTVTVVTATPAIALWINGTSTATSGSLSAGYANGSQAVRVGAGSATAGDGSLDGAIARLAILSVIPTDAEIKRLARCVTGFAFGDGLIEPCEMPIVTRDVEERVTQVSARGVAWAAGQDGALIWQLYAAGSGFSGHQIDSVISIPGSGSRTFTIQLPPWVTTVTTPESGTDYLANTSADGTGTDRTSSFTVTATILGGGRVRLKVANAHASSAYLTLAQLRGTSGVQIGSQAEIVLQEAITGVKSGRELSIDVPFIADLGDSVRDWAVTLFYTYRYAFPKVSARFAWDSDTTIAQMALLEIGDLIYLVDQGDGGNGAWSSWVKDTFYVEGLRHELVPGDVSYTTLTLYPSYLYRWLEKVVFDDFDRANASGDLGTAWSDDVWANDSGFDIVGGYARPNTASTTMATIDLGAPAFDQVVRVALSSMSGSAVAGVVLRRVDANNYLAAVVDRANNLLKLVSVVASTPTTVASYAWTAAATAEVLVMARGRRVQVWLNRVKRIDATCGDHTYGSVVGLYASAASSAALFKGFYAQAL